MSVDQIIDAVLEREGDEYSNDPNDSGGPTRWGITQRTLARYRGQRTTAAEVEALTRHEARLVYRWLFIDAPGFGKIVPLSAPIAEEVIDTAVNCGAGRAAMFLQRCLNALNQNGKIYPDIAVDGDCGPATLRALMTYLSRRGKEGERVLVKALNCLQGEFYIDLAEKRPKDEHWLYGWLKNRVAL